MYHVMLVDDSEVELKEIRRLACWRENAAFVVSCEARNGYEALQQLTESPVDLVITDIRMPKINGLELIQKIKERALAKTVVILSEYREFSYARQGMVLGAFDYLVKPVSAIDLVKLLTRVDRYLTEIAARQSKLQFLEQYAVYSYNNGTEFLNFETAKLKTEVVALNLQAAVTARKLILNLAVIMDLTRVIAVIEKITVEIIAQLERAYPWIGQFIDLESVSRFSYFQIEETERLAEVFVGLITTLIGKINKLKLGDGRNQLVEQACCYVLDHIDQHLTIQRLAETLFIHRSYLSEIFKRQTGVKLNDYLHIVKLERAKKLLVEGRLLNYQIAGLLGFKDVMYFSRIFKKYTGMMPSEYKVAFSVFM
jgi:two-component system response regulator YesN